MNPNYDSDEEQREEPLPPYKVKYSEMPLKPLKEVVKICHEILSKTGQLDKDSAVEIVAKCKENQHLAKLSDGEWQCIIGAHFGAALTYDTKGLTMLVFPDFGKTVMLFRSG